MGNANQPLSKAKEPKLDELSVYDPKTAPFWTDKTDGCGAIRYAKVGFASQTATPALTVGELMAMAAKKRGKSLALAVEPAHLVQIPKDSKQIPPPVPREKWLTWTWEQYHHDTQSFAKACIKAGLLQHDTNSIFGFNSPYWLIAAVGTMVAGGKSSGIYPSDTPEQFQYKCFHSNSSIVTVESNKHLEMVQKMVASLPYLKAVVVWGEEPSLKGTIPNTQVAVYSMKSFLEMGKAEKNDVLEKRTELINPGHCATIIYTSGTTGNPKAVMVTHDNIVFESRVVIGEGIDSVGESSKNPERIVSYLPLSHVAGAMVDIVCPIVITALRNSSCEVYFARPYDLKLGSLVQRLKDVRPTIFLGVPRVWEKIAEKMKQVAAQTTGFKAVIAKWAKAKGLEYSKTHQLGGSGYEPRFYDVADKLVFQKVREGLGLDKMKFGFTGAAPITVETLQYFGSIGINVNECYGMSECTGATTWSTDEAHTWGSVGFPLSGMEVRIFKINGKDKREVPRVKDVLGHHEDPYQGEICFRGRHIMLGYLSNPALGEEHVAEIRKKNAEAVDDDGWLHSGDMGVMDVRGMVRITGRYKELIIGAGGENIAPVPIEDEIKRLAEGVISNVQMIGDKRKFNVAVITLTCKGATGEKPGTDQLDGAAAALVPGVKSIADACKSPEFIKFIETVIKDTNANGQVCPSQASRIGKFTILPKDFSVDGGELTATLKLKRGVVEKEYAAAIDRMYEAEGGATFVPFVA